MPSTAVMTLLLRSGIPFALSAVRLTRMDGALSRYDIPASIARRVDPCFDLRTGFAADRILFSAVNHCLATCLTAAARKAAPTWFAVIASALNTRALDGSTASVAVERGFYGHLSLHLRLWNWPDTRTRDGEGMFTFIRCGLIWHPSHIRRVRIVYCGLI